MRREGESDAGKLADVLARASGLPLEEVTEIVGRTTGQTFQKPEPATELGPKARAALKAAFEERLLSQGELAREAADGERRRVAPSRQPSPVRPPPSERRAAFERSLREAGSTLQLADWTPETHRMVRHVMRRGGRGALEVLGGLPREYARLVRDAALLAAHSEGQPRSWSSPAARRTLCYATALYRMSHRVRRKPGFASVTVGVTVGMLCSLVRNPQTGEPYSRSALVGMLRDGRDPAPLRALAELGAWVRVQPPACQVPQHLRGTDRDGEERAIGQFWFTERVVTDFEKRRAPRAGAPQRARAAQPDHTRPPD